MLSLISNWGIANDNPKEAPLTHRLQWLQFYKLTIPGAKEGVKRLKLSYFAGGNTN